MRVFLVLLLMAFIAGCSTQTRSGSQQGKSAPKAWRFAGVRPTVTEPPCDISSSRQDPVLGAVTARGLSPSMTWLPGGTPKINWTVNSGWQSEIELELRRPGSSHLSYRLRITTGPSLVGMPEPGCWELTLRTPEQTGSIRFLLEAARPVGLVAAMGESPYLPGAKIAEWVDESTVLQLLNAATATPIPTDLNRKSALLYILWKADEERILTPLVYVPSSGGLGAQVIMPKSLLTGDCRDSVVPVAAPISSELAKRLEANLGSSLVISEGKKAPWRLSAGHCDAFERP